MVEKNKLPIMIDTFRKEQDMTLEDIGKKINKSKSAISRWIKGDRSPMIEDLERLADIFQTDIHTLLYGKKTVTVSKTTAELIKVVKQLSDKEQKKTLDFIDNLIAQRTITITLHPINVVEALAAGVGYNYGNNDTITLYTDRDDLKPYDVASAVSGDSMEPLLHNHDVVLIKKNSDFINGEIYAIDYDGKSYVKKVYFEKDTLVLVSLNEKYDNIIIPRHSDDAYLNIVGRVVDWFTPVQV
ncbi:helix-turn-helix domain-containing protein [Carnobacteriaceae bacterium zg-84]|uniref:LexA family transcriptional regulator n=1 Tax=Granulicatella sp. zg-84 TaxID=2678503 RepID=UPI0013D8D62E|nr:LexA family transcriptional regulator [Granulicatella sp. zg-84]QMI85942.1 helix-turn-helix domain-containing protein [Carnobacteriaceae bacterium zg-84]